MYISVKMLETLKTMQ